MVDDDPIILRTLSLELKSRGFEVITASEGSQAICMTRKEKPDVMLLDVNFTPAANRGVVPWNGFVITQWIRSLDDTRNIPVIVISGADREEYMERASAAGAIAFLRKPIDRGELFASIDTALCRQPAAEATGPQPE